MLTFYALVALAASAQPSQAMVAGTIRDARTREPVAQVLVTLADLAKSVETDAAGRYRFVDVPSGPQHLRIERIGYAPRTLHALVPRAGQFRLDASLDPLPVPLGTIHVHTTDRLSAATEGDRADRTASLAGMRSHPRFDEPDALDALAGGTISSDPELPAGLSVRGGSSDHVAYVLDGVPVLSPYHAAGVFGAWNPSSLIDVSLFSATPSPVFPDALSGTVEARTRTPDTRFNGTVGASTSQTSAAVNGPLPFARSGYLLSLRRTFAGSVFHPDEDSYLGGNGTDWLATVTLPAAGGVLHLLSFGNDNEFDAAAAPADAMIPTPGRNEFEWYGRSYGADWRRSGNRGAIRLLAWRATLDASARWQVDQAAWDDLGSSHSSTGALATVQKEGYAARSVAGLRWTRLDAGYAVTGMHGLARDGSLDVVTGFAQHRGGTGTFEYDVTFALSSALRGVRASPGIRVNYMVSSSLSIGAALSRTHQYTQSLRNPESVLGTIFPADLQVVAGAGVPGASSDQVIGLFVYQPMPEIRISAEGYARRLRGLALVAVTESEPFATSPIATGSGEVRGLSLEASLYTSRLAILSSYAWQSVRHGDGAAAFSPAFAAQHRLEAGTVFHATATSSLRAGVTAILGRRATPVTGAIEWESCNLLDRGCELAGSPDVMAGKRGADSLPAYVRIDLGARRHWHVALAGADRQLGLFLTLTNVLGRRNVLRNVIDPETGERSMLGMRPASPLTIGIEGRF